MNEIELGYVIKAFILPPGACVLLGVLALALLRHARRVAVVLGGLALATLWILSMPVTARALAGGLETLPALPAAGPLPTGPQAIVVLGSARYHAAPEYGGADTAGPRLLQRLQYAAALQQRTGLPVLVTGGSLGGGARSEAQVMYEVLRDGFHVPVTWLEEWSANTEQNARYSHEILARAGIQRVYIVTHAMHMPRAMDAFRHAGFDVFPAPTGYRSTEHALGVLDWLPDAEHLVISRDALHEHVGLWWYRMRYGIARAVSG